MLKKSPSLSMDRVFRVLADPTRLRILHLMADREICVCYFSEILQLPQPKISRHLAYLRKAGMVAARREGKWVHYRLVAPKDPVAASILRETLKHLRQIPELQRDAARLNFACCHPKKFQPLQRAPQPTSVHSA